MGVATVGSTDDAAMKIAVINLSGHVERWRGVASQFRDVGLQAVRHEATLGSALAPDRLAALAPPALNRRQYHRPLCVGEIGCYASHVALWRELLASGEPQMAIFEDDVAVSPELPAVLQALAQLPARWDIVKLTGRAKEKIDTRVPLLARRHEPPAGGARERPGVEHQLIQYRRVPCLTSAYAVSRSGAEKLLRHHAAFGRPVDVDMRYWWECGLSLFGVQPYPVRDANSSNDSTIEGRRVPPTPAMRAHKLWLQIDYSLRNWMACRARARARQALPMAGVVMPVGRSPAPRVRG